MSYSKDHKESECDKCLKDVGKLYKVPFLYLDKNDHIHENEGNYYRQYWVCKDCYDRELRIIKKQNLYSRVVQSG